MSRYDDMVIALLGEDIGSGKDITTTNITDFMTEGLQSVVNVLPADQLWQLETDSAFVGTDAGATPGVVGTSISIGSNKVLYVQRLNNTTGKIVECREVPASLKGRVDTGSGWQEEAGEEDPVFYKLNQKIFIEPTITDASSSIISLSNIKALTSADADSVNTIGSVTYADYVKPAVETVSGTSALLIRKDTLYKLGGSKHIVVKIMDGSNKEYQYSTDGGTTFNGVNKDANLYALDTDLDRSIPPSGVTGIHIRWRESTNSVIDLTTDDTYEFTVDDGDRSRVYWIKVPPTSWQYDSTFMDGTVPKEVDSLIIEYVMMRVFERKIGLYQNATSSSLEAFMVEEDIDLVQAQGMLIQAAQSRMQMHQQKFMQGLQVYNQVISQESLDDKKGPPAYGQLTG